MQKDLDYWGIDELLIESCCSLKYFPQLEVCINEKLGDIEAKRRTEEKLKNENFGNTKLGRFRSLIWETIEYPWTSDVARYLGKNCTPSIRIVYFIFYLCHSFNLVVSCCCVNSNIHHFNSRRVTGRNWQILYRPNCASSTIYLHFNLIFSR